MFQALSLTNLAFLFLFFFSNPPEKLPDPSVDPIPVRLINSSVKVERHLFDHPHYGSGTYIAREKDQDFFLTCYHVLHATEENEVLLIKLPEGMITSAKEVAGDKDKDLSLLATKLCKTKIKPIVITDRPLNQTEAFWEAGYPGGEMQLIRNGYYLETHKITNPKYNHFNQTSLRFDIECFHGDSGSAIFDSREKLIGVVWGVNGMGSTEVIGARDVINFLHLKCSNIIPETCKKLPGYVIP